MHTLPLSFLSLLVGTVKITQKNKKVLVRKRLFHKGYQISYIIWDNYRQKNRYVLLKECNSIGSVNDYLKRN